MGKTFNTGRLGNGLFVDANGNVGIGTTVPDNTYQGLTIYGSNPSVRLKGSAIGSWNWIEFVTSAGVNNFSMGVSQSTPLFVIKAGAGLDNPHFTMNASGYVGIGVTSAIQPLHVETSVLNAGIQLYTSEASDGGSAPLFLSKKSTTGSIKTVNIEASGAGHFYIRTGATALNSYGTIRLSIEADGAMGYNSSTIGSRTFTLKATSNRPIAIEMLESGGVHSMYMKPVSSGRHLISSDYISGGVFLPLSLSGRENDSDFVLQTNGNISIGSAADIGTKLQVNGANYIEMATFAAAATASNIVTDNAGYLSMQTRYNSNSSVFQINTSSPWYGIKILKAGLLRVDYMQDITTTGNTGYVASYIRLNGNNIAEALITNTNGQWDGIANAVTLAVSANDIISFYFNATDITSFDQGTWSQYNFVWCSR